MTRVYVGIGSNHQREFHIHAALSALQRCYRRVRWSSAYASGAVNGFSGEFLNLVVGFDTTDSATQVRRHLRRIEAEFGRRRDGTTGSRITLDLDLLLFGSWHGRVEGIRLPHSDIERYAFVLRPLAEIAGSEHHPVSGETFQAMWARFPREAQPLRLVGRREIPDRTRPWMSLPQVLAGSGEGEPVSQL
ncbi:MAG: 2-amino-4-hydroxy-6-hydroxymethyldihydropteridine diphosphokinase [Candidatus Thiodiazotropha sp.]